MYTLVVRHVYIAWFHFVCRNTLHATISSNKHNIKIETNLKIGDAHAL